MKKELQCILFDFDGVLSKDRFYSTLATTHPGLQKEVNKKIFSQDGWPLVEKWMNGQLSFEDMHSQIAGDLGVSVEFLNKALVDSILKMRMNKDILEFAKEARDKGLITAVFTDNMDVFERIFVPYNDLTSKFDYIFSSSSYGKLKNDNNAVFLKEVMRETGIDPSNTLFIDDSEDIGHYMRDFGGNFYLYNDYKNGFKIFRNWLEEEFNYTKL